ncbi:MULTISPECIES: carbohydrate porin [Vibrio]|jgi:maltoporin|uniref:carbohydrate porin n=1 Tax=Vibrio TaxID=662 RepID=UPI0002E89A2A|nr:carbohydrate porin [Vibrio crassostreae]OED81825.1 lactam utilization protein LamB [Vibrio crassostreae ZF-91]
MKHFNLLPISIAVGSFLSCTNLYATENNPTPTPKTAEPSVEDPFIDQQQPMTLTPETKVPEGIIFSGYARYGAHYAGGDKRFVEVGSSGAAVGRLGNEANGGEFQLAKAFETESGAIWDIVVMLDHWGQDIWNSPGGINIAKAYASVTNVIPSQPGMYFWGGLDFHQRPQQNLNDYFWMSHDGQGGGFRNLNLGGTMFDLSFVGQVDEGNGGKLGNDNGIYAFTSKLHDINIGIGDLEFYINYGFASKEAELEKQNETAWQAAALIKFDWSSQLIIRYSDGGDDSVYDLAGEQQALYTSYDGIYNVNDPVAIEYLTSYKRLTGQDVDNRDEYSVIVRPMYNWNDIHSTWLEAGYALEDFHNGDQTEGWKVTLSQNISMGGGPGSRPMIRFYATVGEVDESHYTKEEPNYSKHDTLSAGVMFESWW